MRAGDRAVEIGDGGDHRRPGLGRRVCVGPVVAARMEAEAAGSVQSRDAASAQIRFRDRARDRLRHGEQAPRRFRRSGRRGRGGRAESSIRLGSRQAEKAPGLVGDVAEVDEAAAFADEVEQIAMLAGGGVGLMCS